MPFEIKPATREGVKPLIMPYAESGCGKTYSSLLLARGLAGPNGKIVVADSESRRASLYADVLPGGFDTFDLGEPFTPQRYIEALDAIEASGAAVGIIDSGSHEWEGAGGVLDMAGDNEAKSGRAGLHNWNKPKFEHKLFVQRILRAKIPLIICLRAKFKTRQGKDEKGKTCIVKDDHVSPMQAEDFLFEATAHFEIYQDHSIRLTKWSHPDLKKCFPEKGPISIEHGQLLARWCSSPGGPGTAKPSADPLKDAKSELWKITKHLHFGQAAKLTQWLIDEGVIDSHETAETLDPSRWPEVLRLAKVKLSTVPA